MTSLTTHFRRVRRVTRSIGSKMPGGVSFALAGVMIVGVQAELSILAGQKADRLIAAVERPASPHDFPSRAGGVVRKTIT